MNRGLVAVIGIILAVGIAAAVIGVIQQSSLSDKGSVLPPSDAPPTSSGTAAPKPAETPPTSAQKITVIGNFTCLPHRDRSGPQTMECAFGMRADSGTHYAIDWRAIDPSGMFNMPFDRRYSVTGDFTPLAALSTDQWRRYDIAGILRATSYREADTASRDLILRLNEASPTIAGTSFLVWAVNEDSRCPSDAVCIQAGRVRAAVRFSTPMGASGTEMGIGDTYTTETLSITLARVDPYPVSTRRADASEYRFFFTAKER